MPNCPNCHRRLTDHGLFLFGGHDLIVCKRCGARLRTRVSWLCALMIGCITAALIAAWAYFSEYHRIILAAFILWACLAPFIQDRFTIIERKYKSKRKLLGNRPIDHRTP